MNKKRIDYRRRKQQGFVIKFKPLSGAELDKFRKDFEAATSGMSGRMIVPMADTNPEFSIHWDSPKAASRKRLRISTKVVPEVPAPFDPIEAAKAFQMLTDEALIIVNRFKSLQDAYYWMQNCSITQMAKIFNDIPEWLKAGKIS